jgi:hypothetical protein
MYKKYKTRNRVWEIWDFEFVSDFVLRISDLSGRWSRLGPDKISASSGKGGNNV